MRTLTVKLYGSDDFGYLGDMINIAGIIYNTALTSYRTTIPKQGSFWINTNSRNSSATFATRMKTATGVMWEVRRYRT
ncbi:MAG: hypothetical protein SO157_01015 [Bullifex sp.]|nr:hypothetical protein [Bullifex sp.]